MPRCLLGDVLGIERRELDAAPHGLPAWLIRARRSASQRRRVSRGVMVAMSSSISAIVFRASCSCCRTRPNSTSSCVASRVGSVVLCSLLKTDVLRLGFHAGVDGSDYVTLWPDYDPQPADVAGVRGRSPLELSRAADGAMPQFR